MSTRRRSVDRCRRSSRSGCDPAHRGRIGAFTDRIRARPEVRNVYFLAGADDFLLDVATADSLAMRDFVVDQLSAFAEVASTETNLIFDHVRGDTWLT